MKVALTYWVDRFRLERRGGVNVLYITSNASRGIGVMYETRSVIASKAGCICSAGSSGSVSSFRMRRCVRAFHLFAAIDPVLFSGKFFR